MRDSASFLISLITVSTSVYQRAFLAAHHQVEQGAGLVHVEDADRHVMVTHQADGGQIHDPQLLVQRIVIAELVVLDGVIMLDRVLVVDPVHLGGLDHHVGVDLDAAQAGRGVGGKEGVTGTGGEQYHIYGGEVADGGATVIVLHHAAHGNRGHHPGADVGTLQGVAHGQGVHHRGQHAHMVAGHPIHARLVEGGATEQVAAADHDADLHPDPDQLADLQGHAVQHLGVDAEVRS